MADENLNKKHGADKELRRARDRFKSQKTQQALNEAILEVPGTTVFDTERIIIQIGDRLVDFKNIEGFKQFRSAVVAWATRQVQLITNLRAILRELCIDGHIATMLVIRLPEFTGTDEDLRSWVQVTDARETEGLQALTAWITEHRQAVRYGVWEVLRDCIDLGVRGFSGEESDPIMDELEMQVWRGVAYGTNEILGSNEPISRLLWWKGYWTAKAWKTRRLLEKEKVDDKIVVDIDTIIKGEDRRGIIVEAVIDLEAVHNPIIVRERPWTQADLERELRRAGPFRAHDPAEVTETLSTA